MADAGGVVFRKPRIEAVDEQWAAEMNALDRDLTEPIDLRSDTLTKPTRATRPDPWPAGRVSGAPK